MNDEINVIFKLFLILHISGGSVGLATGLINILRKKGTSNHKLIGKIFFIAMLVTGTSALVLAIVNPNQFLFMVGVFTLYMVGTGQRYLRHKSRAVIVPNAIDWSITLLMFIAGFLFIILGILALIKSNFFGIVFFTFGSLALLFVRQDFKNYRGKSTTLNLGLIAHLQRMTGAFIAALTAFLVVNAKHLPDQIPGILHWLLPTIILTPLIVSWSRKYEMRKK